MQLSLSEIKTVVTCFGSSALGSLPRGRNGLSCCMLTCSCYRYLRFETATGPAEEAAQDLMKGAMSVVSRALRDMKLEMRSSKDSDVEFTRTVPLRVCDLSSLGVCCSSGHPDIWLVLGSCDAPAII